MRKSLNCSLIVFLAVVASSFAVPDKAAIEVKEKAAWQTYKERKADDFRKVVDKDVRCVYADGVHNMQRELSDMNKWDIKSFEISDYKTFSDEKDMVVSTYVVKLEAALEGKDMSGTYNAGTVWKQENGNWLAIFHTHVKQEK
jgi:hypothetical protein